MSTCIIFNIDQVSLLEQTQERSNCLKRSSWCFDENTLLTASPAFTEPVQNGSIRRTSTSLLYQTMRILYNSTEMSKKHWEGLLARYLKVSKSFRMEVNLQWRRVKASGKLPSDLALYIWSVLQQTRRSFKFVNMRFDCSVRANVASCFLEALS